MKKSFFHPKLLLPILIFLFLAAALLMILIRPSRPVAADTAEERIAVTVLETQPESLEDRLVLPGKVAAFEDLTLAAEQMGRVSARPFAEGAGVEKGDLILHIDDLSWRTALRQAEIRLTDTRRALRRAEELHRDGALAKSELEKSQTAFQQAETALEEAAIQLQRCRVEAPINGRVEKLFVSPGEHVTPGQPVARLLDLNRVKIVFDLPEREIRSLREGDECKIELDAMPEKQLSGKVTFISSAANPANNAFRVELEADNPEGVLRAGLIVRVMVLRGIVEDAVILPLQAIVPMDGETLVYLESEGYAERRIVRIASIHDSRAVISRGVEPGVRVIVDGNRNVLDGTPVEVMTDWQPAPIP